MPISKRLRYEILRRDNHACRYCGATAPDVPLTVDHVVPVALGGSDDAGNLVTACRDCNSGKAASSASDRVVADVDADAIRWAAAMRQAAEIAMRERDAIIEVEQAVWKCFGDELGEYLPNDWYVSVDRFAAAGLTLEDLVDAAYLAINARHVRINGMWRYFCGVCWKRVSERQEAARALIAAEGDA